jgi:hypothetical protein
MGSIVIVLSIVIIFGAEVTRRWAERRIEAQSSGGTVLG